MLVSTVSRGARRGPGSSELGVTGGCEWCPFWVLDPLQEQYMLLTAESSFQHYDWEFLIVNDCARLYQCKMEPNNLNFKFSGLVHCSWLFNSVLPRPANFFLNLLAYWIKRKRRKSVLIKSVCNLDIFLKSMCVYITCHFKPFLSFSSILNYFQINVHGFILSYCFVLCCILYL